MAHEQEHQQPATANAADGQSRNAPPTSVPWAIVGTLPCLKCDYDLKGLEGPKVTCPECRHVNDLRDAQPWREKLFPRGIRERIYWPGHASGLAGLGLILLLVSTRTLLVSGFRDPFMILMTLVTLLLLAGAGLCFWRTYLVVRSFSRSCHRPSHGCTLLTLYNISIVAMVLAFFWGISSMSEATRSRTDPMDTFHWSDIWFAVPFVGALIASRLTKWLIQRGERTGLYRDQPEDFTLPVAAIYTPDDGGDS